MLKNKIFKIPVFAAVLFLLYACAPALVKTGEAQFFSLDSEVPADPITQKFIQPFKENLEKEMNTVIGRTTEAILKNGNGETAIGNLVADFQKEFAENLLGYPIDISIINNGGIRNTLPKGNITLGNIYELSPFDNYLQILELDHRELIALAEFAVSRKILGISGMTIHAQDGKILELKINGEEVNPAKKYILAVNDYLANGGDGMGFLSEIPRKAETDYLLREILIDRIKAKTASGLNIEAKVEGRQKFD
ncbi:5'-nucleotidase C-terminal domain-containing protein [Cecembia calidifontis]|uniref:5'-nucleotidase-like protein n=1 Tax=Cecembia calidifontis TaxID=1187080 RepID=A0A4Q7P3K4_9BACT|nr:5'-nucleotidase [Cecembia calidifontis]RZS94516.1 5'-nucleotidase-like protein [Cecembia calidifontis]